MLRRVLKVTSFAASRSLRPTVRFHGVKFDGTARGQGAAAQNGFKRGLDDTDGEPGTSATNYENVFKRGPDDGASGTSSAGHQNVFKRKLYEDLNATPPQLIIHSYTRWPKSYGRTCRSQRAVGKQKTPMADEIHTVATLVTERQKKILSLQSEIRRVAEKGYRVPPINLITETEWDKLLAKRSNSKRFRYYRLLYHNYTRKLKKERVQQERTRDRAEHREHMARLRAECQHIVYGSYNVSMFLQLYDTTIDRWYNNRLVSAMLHAPKLVLDCSYDSHMTEHDAKKLSRLLLACFQRNRAHDQPFDLHFCNAQNTSEAIQQLGRLVPTLHSPAYPLQLHAQCYTKLFPKERLVYLTPHCEEQLVDYDAEDVYVVGAMVNKKEEAHHSLRKAKQLGLRMAKLPINKHRQLSCNPEKTLTIVQMMKIMLDIKATGDWRHSLRHIAFDKPLVARSGNERVLAALRLSKAQQESIRELAVSV